MNPLPIHIDSTMLTTFRSCPRKFKEEYVDLRRPKALSIHLHAGGAFAAGLEAWREAHFLGGLSSEAAQVPAMKAFIDYWGTFDVPPDSPKSFWRVAAALSSYMDTYPLETDHLRPLHPNAFEYSFAIPTKTLHPKGTPFLFSGRIDLLASFNGQPVVVDEKTTTALGESWAKKWSMRGQFLGYLWAVNQVGIPAKAAVVRGTAIKKTETAHLEVYQQYPSHLIETWSVHLEQTLQNMIRAWTEDRWDMNFGDTCHSFNNCPYIQLCSSARPEIWYADYEVTTWNPLLRNPIRATPAELEAIKLKELTK